MGYTVLAGYKLISFDKIPSTQTYALGMVATGMARDHTVILAMPNRRAVVDIAAHGCRIMEICTPVLFMMLMNATRVCHMLLRLLWQKH